MKKLFLCLILSITAIQISAQKIIEKTYKVSKDQPVVLKFGFPTVKVSSWDRDEISLKATVNINDNKQNDLYSLLEGNKNGTLVISDSISTRQIDPQYYIEDNNGNKKRFETKTDFENYQKAHKSEIRASYTNNQIDVQIELKLPVKEYIKLKTKFGLVEAQNVRGPLIIETEFGKIDAKIAQSQVGKIKLTNQFGKIYSDFDMKPTEKEERMFFTSITSSPGRGPSYELTSKFGNIYLRNQK